MLGVMPPAEGFNAFLLCLEPSALAFSARRLDLDSVARRTSKVKVLAFDALAPYFLHVVS